jgi:predicted secreted protein
MAAEAGRNLLIDVDDFAGGVSAEITGQVTGNLTINREAIDITTKSDLGVQTLLADIGKFSFEVGFEGILEDSVLLAIASDAAPTALGVATVTIGSIGTLSGSFFLSNFTVTGEDGPNAIGYTATLMSSGTVTFT